MVQEAPINRFKVLYGRGGDAVPSLAERKYHASGGVVPTMGQLNNTAYTQGRDGIRWEPDMAKRGRSVGDAFGATHWSRERGDPFGTSRRVHMEVLEDGKTDVSFSAMVEGKDEDGKVVINAEMLPLREYLSRPEVWMYLDNDKIVEEFMLSPTIELARYAFEHAEPISDNVPSGNPHI